MAVTKEQLMKQVETLSAQLVMLEKSNVALTKDNERLHKLEDELDAEVRRISRAMYFTGREKEILEKERDLAREQKKEVERQWQESRNK